MKVKIFEDYAIDVEKKINDWLREEKLDPGDIYYIKQSGNTVGHSEEIGSLTCISVWYDKDTPDV